MNLTPSEAQEQEALFEWAGRMEGRWPELALLHHIPNGGGRDPREGRHLKDQGVKPGVPDICLPVARGGHHGLYVELKRRKGWRLSNEQAKWIRALNAQGYLALVCVGWDEARRRIEEYLQGGNQRQ